MSEQRGHGARDLFDGEEVREVLRDTFYTDPADAQDARPRAPARRSPRKARRPKAKPEHYEVICISLYTEDLARLDAKVKALKGNGHRKISRSALIRYALDTVDLDALPRSY